MKHLAILALLFAAANIAEARFPDLSKFMEDEISTIATALDSTPNSTSVELEEAWLMKRFAVRVRGKVGFEIPGIAKIQFIPELEMVWDRGWADGWGGYKP